MQDMLTHAPFVIEGLDAQPVDPAFLEEVLTPYRTNCRYLTSVIAQVEPKDDTKESASELANADIVLHGEFAIPDSCYIDDTGHFNAVEFNICYNQIAYCYMAFVIANGLQPTLSNYDLPSFYEKQLSNFLITTTQTKYASSLNAKRFFGSFRIANARSTRYGVRFDTEMAFRDGSAGRAHGEVVLAVLAPTPATVEAPPAQAQSVG